MAFRMNTAQQAIIDALAIDFSQKGNRELKPIYKFSSSKKTGANLRNPRSPINNNGAIMDRAYAGKVLAAIPNNRIAQKFAWFCYGPVIVVAEMETVLQWLYSNIHGDVTKSQILKSLKQSNRLNNLIVFAALNYRYSRFSQVDRYSISDMCRDMELARGNWTRDWAPVYEQMIKLLDKLDHSILKPVRAMIEVEKKRSEINI